MEWDDVPFLLRLSSACAINFETGDKASTTDFEYPLEDLDSNALFSKSTKFSMIPSELGGWVGEVIFFEALLFGLFFASFSESVESA
jgi:hypothetical protein